MVERKRTYQSKAQSAAVLRLAPILTPGKPDGETDLARQVSLNQSLADPKIDLLNRLIKHLKTL
jgi:hypothetical protein